MKKFVPDISPVMREVSAHIAGALKKPLPGNAAECGNNRARKLIDAVWDIENVADMRSFRPLLKT